MQRINFSPLISLVLLLISSQAFAIGLGEIELTSRLNQRFEAQIPVLVNTETDAEDLTVRLADKVYFERAGLNRGANVLALRFEPKRLSADQMVIKVSTREAVREPILRFIIEVKYNDSRSIRQFTTFLEVPQH